MDSNFKGIRGSYEYMIGNRLKSEGLFREWPEPNSATFQKTEKGISFIFFLMCFKHLFYSLLIIIDYTYKFGLDD